MPSKIRNARRILVCAGLIIRNQSRITITKQEWTCGPYRFLFLKALLRTKWLKVLLLWKIYKKKSSINYMKKLFRKLFFRPLKQFNSMDKSMVFSFFKRLPFWCPRSFQKTKIDKALIDSNFIISYHFGNYLHSLVDCNFSSF